MRSFKMEIIPPCVVGANPTKFLCTHERRLDSPRRQRSSCFFPIKVKEVDLRSTHVGKDLISTQCFARSQIIVFAI
ncbi:Uncharacterized protein APZ42_025107 [Daphnia magna]|uniref:Uncharacterized protein n=1 Tax=Daphnia magna TaxID=35525 RepID=A0A0P4YAV7_9CRUS|nr:Uncharacterized protein APZ42_025107 [Daphnia magna]